MRALGTPGAPPGLPPSPARRSPAVVGQHGVVVEQQKVPQLRGDGEPPVVQDERQVGAAPRRPPGCGDGMGLRGAGRPPSPAAGCAPTAARRGSRPLPSARSSHAAGWRFSLAAAPRAARSRRGRSRAMAGGGAVRRSPALGEQLRRDLSPARGHPCRAPRAPPGP